MTKHLRLLILAMTAAALLPCCQGYAETRVAVIASQAAGVEKLVPLVELRLTQNKGIVLLEREKIKEIVREQELQSLTAAEGTSKRIGLGKLLKADLLILLREQEDEQPPPGAPDASLPQSDRPRPHASLVVCETAQGLRLCNRPVELTQDVEADARAVVCLAEGAIEKLRARSVDIVAVPPLVNNTLAFDAD